MKRILYTAPATDIVALTTADKLMQQVDIDLTSNLDPAEPGDELNSNTTTWDDPENSSLQPRLGLWDEE